MPREGAAWVVGVVLNGGDEWGEVAGYEMSGFN
jgi:hypothetical protein